MSIDVNGDGTATFTCIFSKPTTLTTWTFGLNATDADTFAANVTLTPTNVHAPFANITAVVQTPTGYPADDPSAPISFAVCGVGGLGPAARLPPTM